MTATRPTGAANVKVVRPGEGDVGVLGKHVHHREDEISYVLEGEIGFRSEDDEVVLAPGGYADRYALPFAEPAWLPDVIERYGLHPTG